MTKRMSNPNYVDGLELRIKELITERNGALAKNTKLVAQVEALRKVVIEPAIDAAIIYSVKTILNKTPAQCLRDVQAEAVETGYYNGFKDALIIEPPLPPATGTSATIDVFAYRVEQASRYAASQYAAKVRESSK